MTSHRPVIVGTGIAGLWTAWRLASEGRGTVVLTKETLADSASAWAQGGIAVALGPGDSPSQHAADTLAAGDGLAIIESREIADAKGEFLAASRAANLANVTLTRETRLWKQRVSAEQDFLQARAAAEEATIRLDLARQRLSALGLAGNEIAALAAQPVAALRRLELRAPIAGRVIARAAVQGAAVAADAELFSVADLTTL
jgi:cobalt-zinc-cadmium efflux system membrane fusion protein